MKKLALVLSVLCLGACAGGAIDLHPVAAGLEDIKILYRATCANPEVFAKIPDNVKVCEAAKTGVNFTIDLYSVLNEAAEKQAAE